MQYEYGGAYKKYPVDDFVFPDGSRLAVRNIMNGPPDWMLGADLVFCDPPWNQGNLRAFCTKNGEELRYTFDDFLVQLFRWIERIAPATAYVEMGKQHLADAITAMRKVFPYVTFYNSMYYRRPENLCYVVRGSRRAKKPKLDGMDEEQIIRWVCENEEYDCIADPCMGQGPAAYYASKAGKRFLGTDMNPKRLAVARKRVESGRR